LKPKTAVIMPTRSKEEVRVISRLLRALGVPCDVKAVIDALEAGARDSLWDAKIRLEGGVWLYIDHDGGHFHTSARLESDTDKTLRKLAEDEQCRVLRLRAGAPPIFVDNVRCATPLVAKRVPKKVRIDPVVADALVAIVPDAYRDQLKKMYASKTDDVAAARVAAEVLETLEERYRDQLALLEMVLGSTKLAKKLHKTDGVHTLMQTGVLVEVLKMFMERLLLDVEEIVRFMSHGVVARMTDPKFIAAIEALRVKYDLDNTQLMTVVGMDGVASRLTDPKFIAAIEELSDGRDLLTVVRMVGNSQVAARLMNGTFLKQLRKWEEPSPKRLKTLFGLYTCV